jgi:hypothetical protein
MMNSDEMFVADDLLSIVQSSTMLLIDYKIQVADIVKKKIRFPLQFYSDFIFCMSNPILKEVNNMAGVVRSERR